MTLPENITPAETAQQTTDNSQMAEAQRILAELRANPDADKRYPKWLEELREKQQKPAANFDPNMYSRKITNATLAFLNQHPNYVDLAMRNDPALASLSREGALEQLQSYPGVRALAVHEIVHHEYLHALTLSDEAERNDVLRSARWFSEAAHAQTGLDIHPGATIAPTVFIDHGAGVVIGEKARVGGGTRMNHDVTLGAAGKPPKDGKRHPEIGENCMLSVGVKILGHVVVGNGVVFGPGAIVQGNNVRIGDGAKIGTAAHIGNGNTIEKDVLIGAGVDIPDKIGIIDCEVPSFSKVSRGEDGKLKFMAHSPSPRENISMGVSL